MKRSRISIALGAVLSLTLAACGSGSGGGDSTVTPTSPTFTSTTSTSTTTSSSTAVSERIKRVIEQSDNLPRGTAKQGTTAVLSSSNQGGQLNPTATSQYAVAVIKHADTIWTNWFKSNNLAEPWVGYQLIMPGQSYTSKCPLDGSYTYVHDTPNAVYCDEDKNSTDNGMLILPVTTLGKMWTGNIFNSQVSDKKRVGDFAAAVLVAHEFGHHIQFELAKAFKKKNPSNPNLELIADCFAGVWAYSVFLDGFLEAGDINEAVNAVGAIGDNVGSHGTDAQRANALKIGFSGLTTNPKPGLPANCINTYWPEFSLN